MSEIPLPCDVCSKQLPLGSPPPGGLSSSLDPSMVGSHCTVTFKDQISLPDISNIQETRTLGSNFSSIMEPLATQSNKQDIVFVMQHEVQYQKVK
ncbi:hypothetical protein V6N11_046170 [Hibiscus sabdariffa]|uniref:Uncharacterized protein n=1 Tax=Hibiscus sabdariffa TaxID=183260 RepID=A0ABR2A1Y3_9ROSI